MLRDLLSSISAGADDHDDGLAELVVTALGSSGSHYVCWKTHSGQYKQRSHGLPPRLEQWLFPADGGGGGTRDFATLQVVLSGEDDFWASDRDGAIRSSDGNGPSSRQRQLQLRRASTLGGGGGGETTTTMMKRERRELGSDGRPRSSTLPTMAAEKTTPPPPPWPMAAAAKADPHTRSSSVGGRLRRATAVSVAFQLSRRKPAARPSSAEPAGGRGGAGEGLAVLPEREIMPAPRPVSAADPGRPSSSTTTTTMTSHPSRSSTRSASPSDNRERLGPMMVPKKPLLALTIPSRRRPAYADASVQTEPLGNPDSDVRPEHSRASSFASATSSRVDFYGRRSQRSSLETVVSRPDAESDAESDRKKEEDVCRRRGGGGSGNDVNSPCRCCCCPPPNPVVMGRMQDYFRSRAYVLGGALHPQGMG
ncbi:hypothetical protein GGR56DRAFT_692188 [Xylariaceae sp. FL0804]|nr:hypothetical protein GGR56DRAFT_692188 [Xylariaceae sp. FL0804]